MRKILILGSQNPSQTIPKRCPKRRPAKDAVFGVFLHIFFDLCERRNLENINISLIKSMILRISITSTLWCSDSFRRHKNIEKTLQNGAETTIKLSLKTTCCSTSIFFGLGLHFARVGAPLGQLWGALGQLLDPLGRSLGASWALPGRSWAPPGCSDMEFGCILPPRDTPNLDLGGSRIDFGGPRGRFWRSQESHARASSL